MGISYTLDGVLASVQPLLDAGVSLHWLRERSKAPVEEKWAAADTKTVEQLRNSYRPGFNIGLRPGKWSKTPGGYVHVIDLDIRRPEKAEEAWAELLELLPSARSLPTVQSGSGGESRHIYFLTAEPFATKKLRQSTGFDMVPDPSKGRDVKKFHWEIDLCGTGKNVAIPPSIHPDSGKPYRWIRPLDLDMPDLMTLPLSMVQGWGVRVASTEAFNDEDDFEIAVLMSPLRLDDGVIEKTIADLPANWVDDYYKWVDVGMAFFHQFEGSEEGLELWCEWSSDGLSYEQKACEDKWPSLAWKPRHKDDRPITFATLIQAANFARLERDLDFDDDDGFDLIPDKPPVSTDLTDLLGPPEPVVNDKADPDWKQKLHLNEEGELKSTLPNITLIFENDTRTRATAWYNEFKQEVVLRKKPGRLVKKRASGHDPFNLEGALWQIRDHENGMNWHDSHDHAVRHCFEAKTTLGGYGIKISDRDLKSAIDIVAQKRTFHPVRMAIESVQWDGIPRAETLFIDYLKTKDNSYHRQAALLTLVGAVARVYRPGHKFDFVPILEGLQGAGKSTFIKTLGLSWSKSLSVDISDRKAAVEVMLGSWILEIGELSAMHKAEVNELKDFVSQTDDRVRLAWEKRARDFPRQCIFIGSTNDREYLRDQTGGRRWWPIVCEIAEGDEIDIPLLESNIMQIWAETLVIYRQMESQFGARTLPLYMKGEAAQIAKIMQESRRVETSEDMLAGRIVAWLDTPIGDDFDDVEETPKVYRNETCIAQLWEEMIGKPGPIPQGEAVKLGKAMLQTGWNRSTGPVRTSEVNKKYGACRVYYRPE